jgi:hypothetical protein
MMDSDAETNVGMKAAQVGFTEAVLNKSFFTVDVKSTDCLYILPAKIPDAKDFSVGRFDTALELSDHLSHLFSDVKNIGHKRAGTTNLYIRGSKSRSALKSIPVGLIIIDELEEMNQKNIPLALERTAGQIEKQVWMISTPRIENDGIHKQFKLSTQEQFFFKCPHCDKYVSFEFPDSIEITATEENDPKIDGTFLKCRFCKSKLLHEEKPLYLAKGIWVPEYADRVIRGFHISQMYSSTVSPVALAKSYIRAQYDPTEEQEFYNSKLGKPHVVGSGQITDEQIRACQSDFRNHSMPMRTRLVTMGIDVGRYLHVEIDEWQPPLVYTNSDDFLVLSRARAVCITKCQHFEELDQLVRNYGVNFCVIDAHPERRKAYEFTCRFPNTKMCFYNQGISGKQIHEWSDENTEPGIGVDRTSWLDLSLGRVKRGRDFLALPQDTPEEYKAHLKALVRIYERDAGGNPIGRYVNGNNDDHYAHARNYSEIALQLAVSLSASQDITESIL